MDLVLTGVAAGVLGTLAMDLLNLLFARTGRISRIDVGKIGRMAVGWTRGRFLELATHFGRYGYRRITALLRGEGSASGWRGSGVRRA